MSILVVLVTLFFAALGFYGYKAIEERAVIAAEKEAAVVAQKATEAAIAEYRDREQGSAMGVSQPTTKQKRKPSELPGLSTKKTSDSSLISRGKKNDHH
jgi:hypothetical protein